MSLYVFKTHTPRVNSNDTIDFGWYDVLMKVHRFKMLIVGEAVHTWGRGNVENHCTFCSSLLWAWNCSKKWSLLNFEKYTCIANIPAAFLNLRDKALALESENLSFLHASAVDSFWVSELVRLQWHPHASFYLSLEWMCCLSPLSNGKNKTILPSLLQHRSES